MASREVLVAATLLFGPVAAAQELTLGSVALRLGASEAATVTLLREQFSVSAVDGGWAVRSRVPGDTRTPSVGLRVQNGRIHDVSFIWGPGSAPDLDAMFDQLSHALPAEAACQVSNVAKPSEGGIVRTLMFRCGASAVRCSSGVWREGTTASISIGVEE